MADTSTRRTQSAPASSKGERQPASASQASARDRRQAGAQARVEARAEARQRAGRSGATATSPAATAERGSTGGRSDGADWRSGTSSLEPVRDKLRSSAPAARTSVAAPRGRQPRRARLRLTRVDPWSVMKTSFMLSIAFAIVTIVAVVIVWSVLGAAGVWDSINASVESVIGGEESQNFDVENYVGMTRVLGFTMLVAVIDVVLITALATLTAFLYNMSAALLGGVEVTLAEDPR